MKKFISALMYFLILILSTIVLSFFSGCEENVFDQKMHNVEIGLHISPNVIKGEKTWTIQERMKYYNVPGVSIAVINDFKIDWAKTYGIKDIETGEKVTTNTLFQAASISKSLTAAIAFKKVENGILILNENINTHLKSWKLPDNEYTKQEKVTLERILSHSGGLSTGGFAGYKVNELLPSVLQILDGIDPANSSAVRVITNPGDRFMYSGGGTTILQLALMDLDQQSFPKIAEKQIFSPLQMNNTTFQQPLPDKFKYNFASGHTRNGTVIEGRHYIYPEMAAAGLWSTPTDLAMFVIEIQKSLLNNSNKVLSRDMVEKMVTPFQCDYTGNGVSGPFNEVGLGLFINNLDSSVYFGSDGGNYGYRARYYAHLHKGYGAVIMVNSNNGQIRDEILRSIAMEYQWDNYPNVYEMIKIDEEVLEKFVGRYILNQDEVLIVTRGESNLEGEKIPITGEEIKYKLLPVSENVFISQNPPEHYEFVSNYNVKDTLIIRANNKIVSTTVYTKDNLTIPFEFILDGRYDEALKRYQKILIKEPENLIVSESRFNKIGYRYLNRNNIQLAIDVFILNTELHPNSSNVFDSLAEAYMKNGQKELAIKNYKKSLEFNPDNENARKMLKKLNDAI